jgi:4-amino-4-deoxy-L-arabinose transferase-like glycosyltransferase
VRLHGDRPGQDRIGPRDIGVMATLVLLGVGIPLWMATVAGAIGIPASDDWVYTRGAESLFRTGSIDMPGRTAASVSQMALVQPLLWLSGGDPWAYTAFGLIMTAIGLSATYLLARRFVGTSAAALITLLVVTFPGLSRQSTTFMTDLPAFALIALCLLLGARWLEGDEAFAMLLASLAVGILAVGIREFAIAAPLAVLGGSWIRSGRAKRRGLAAVSIAFGVGVLGLLLLAASIPGRVAGVDPESWRLFLLGPIFATLAAVVLPAIVLATGQRMEAIRPKHILIGVGVVLLSTLIPWAWLPGNLWMQNGLAGNILLDGTRGDVFDPVTWFVSRQIATLAAILLVALALGSFQRAIVPVNPWSRLATRAIGVARSRHGVLLLFLFGYAAELVYFAPNWIYDRFLIPIVPVVAILLLRRQSPSPGPRFGLTLAFAHASLIWLSFSAIVIAANSFAYDAARWNEGERLVAMGYDAGTVDAGYEWIGFHASGIVRPDAPTNNTTWTGVRWALIRPCAVISNSPLETPDLTLVRVNRDAYLNYLIAGPPQPLYVYGATTRDCPTVPRLTTLDRGQLAWPRVHFERHSSLVLREAGT